MSLWPQLLTLLKHAGFLEHTMYDPSSGPLYLLFTSAWNAVYSYTHMFKCSIHLSSHSSCGAAIWALLSWFFCSGEVISQGLGSHLRLACGRICFHSHDYWQNSDPGRMWALGPPLLASYHLEVTLFPCNAVVFVQWLTLSKLAGKEELIKNVS